MLDTLKLSLNLEDIHVYNEHTSRDKSISYRNFYQNNQTLIDIVYHEFYDDIKRFNYTFFWPAYIIDEKIVKKKKTKSFFLYFSYTAFFF